MATNTFGLLATAGMIAVAALPGVGTAVAQSRGGGGGGGGGSGGPADGGITVTSPAGGEVWAPGTVHLLTWAISGNPGTSVRIELYCGANLARTISSSTAATQLGLSWTVPLDALPDAVYTVHIASLDVPTVSDISGAFTIAVPAPTGLCLDSADDTGISNTDTITRQTTGLTIRGQTSAVGSPGATVTLYEGTTPIPGGTGAAWHGPSSVFAIDVSLPEGSHAITATCTMNGLTSATAAPFVLTVDATAPVITGLADDTTPRLSKTWSWGAADATAVMYRFAVDQSSAWTPAGLYADTATATKAGAPGVWYLHVQARDAAGNESGVTTVVATLANGPPAVASAASASPNPATGTAVNLSVLGSDDSGESGLTYAWATAGTAPGTVLFSGNGGNAAKNTVATFGAAGNYSFTVTITDAGGLTAAGSVSVTVNQTCTAVTIAPAGIVVEINGTRNFAATARDQFGMAMQTQPAFTWSAIGAGSIGSSTGTYSAGATAGTAAITAIGAGLAGTAGVRVAPVVTVPLSLVRGWNLISLALEPVSPDPADVFGTGSILGSVWRWDAANRHLAQAQQLQPFAGYWVYAPAERLITVQGAEATSVLVNLVTGWNLVGPAAEVGPPPGGVCWGWKPGTGGTLTMAKKLAPGSGYWIHVPQAMTWDAAAGAMVP